MKPKEAILLLKARSATTVLNTLLQIRKSIEAGDEREDFVEPLTTVMLSNGRELRGYVMDIGEETGGRWVLLRIPYDGRDALMSIAYVELHAICGVIVENIQDVLHQLSFGALEAPPRDEELSALELRRRTEKFASRVSELSGAQVVFETDWKALPRTNDALWAAHDLMSGAASAISDIARTPDGKVAVASLKMVKFTDQKEPGAELKNAVLIIKGAFAPGEKKLGRSELRAAIEALF